MASTPSIASRSCADTRRASTSAGKAIGIEGRDPLKYDALLLATGAEPIRLDIPGAKAPHVHLLRTLADSRAIIAAAKGAKRAVVIGSSFIGLEVAASLRKRDVAVDVVAPEDLPLARVLGDHLGRFIRTLHESHGVTFHLGRKPQRIETDAVVLDDDTRLAADLVVMGVGVRPRLQLAEQAGLATGSWGRRERTPRDERARDLRRGRHRALARRAHAATASASSIGSSHSVRVRPRRATSSALVSAIAQVPFFWSAHYDVSINYVGHAEKWDRGSRSMATLRKQDVAVRFIRGGKADALATIFRDDESLRFEQGRG